MTPRDGVIDRRIIRKLVTSCWITVQARIDGFGARSCPAFIGHEG